MRTEFSNNDIGKKQNSLEVNVVSGHVMAFLEFATRKILEGHARNTDSDVNGSCRKLIRQTSGYR